MSVAVIGLKSATCLSTYVPALIAHDRSQAAKASELVAQEWERKKRKTEKEKAATKKRLDKARGQTRVSISMAFQWWQELRELKGLKSDAVSTNSSHIGCLCYNIIMIMLGVFKLVNETWGSG